jgi:Ca2+-binding RTX toxin-like protein
MRAFRARWILPVLVLAAPAPSAAASTVRLEMSSASTATLLYQAGNREANDMSLRPGGGNRYVVDGVERAGPGCAMGAEFGRVVCALPQGATTLVAVIRLGSRNDEASLQLGRRRPGRLVAHGGPGDDLINAHVVTKPPRRSLLTGGPGDDDLAGSTAGDRIRGGPGDDFLHGWFGSDVLSAGPGRDIALAGDGDDRIDLRDDFTDRVRCGFGHDVAWLDAQDELRKGDGCDRVRPS